MPGDARTLNVEVKIVGKDLVISGLKDIEGAGTKAATQVAEKMDKAGQSMMQFGEKCTRLGNILNQNVTLPLVALGAAAVKMTLDVYKGSEAMAVLKNKSIELKVEIAHALNPVIEEFTRNSLIPMIDKLYELVAAWDRQSTAAKNSQLIMIGGAAAVGPVLSWLGQIATAVGILELAWAGLYIRAGAAIALIAPWAGALGLSFAGASYTAKVFGGPGGMYPFTAMGVQTNAGAVANAFIPGYGGGSTSTGMSAENQAWAAMGYGPGGMGPQFVAPIVAPTTPHSGGGGAGREVRIPGTAFMAPSAYDLSGQISGMIESGHGGGPFNILDSGYTLGRLRHPSTSYESGMTSRFKPQGHVGGYLGFPGQYGVKKGPGPGPVPIWQRNDFLMGVGIQAAEVATGQASWTSMLPVIGSAFGPVGGAVGGLLAGIFGRKKNKGDTPANPVYVKVTNPGDITMALLNASKSGLLVGASGNINQITAELKLQAARIGHG